MRKKIVLVQVIILVIATFLMLGTVSYAWFSKFDKTDVIVIDSASLKVEANLFYKKNIEDEYELKDGVVIAVKDMIPGDTFYFKVVVKNVGTIPGKLSIDTSNVSISEGHQGVFEYIIDENNFLFETENNLLTNESVFPGKTVELEFQIYVNGSLTNEDSNNHNYLSLIIESIRIKLDQIQP